MKFFTLFILFFPLIIRASELTQTITNQGFTGLINTPNARVMKEGDITLHYDNQFDNCLRAYDYKKKSHGNDNYIFGVGFFRYMEVQGRLSETSGYHRDLSGNIKFQLPFKHKYLPKIAIGGQDIGSASNHYGNYYAVMDKELGILRASLGYGHSTVEDETKKRMNGIFGGIEVKTFKWLYLVAEDDSKERFAGVKFLMPRHWSSLFKLNALVSTNITHDYETNIGLNLTFPLYQNTTSYSAHEINIDHKELHLSKKSNSPVKPSPKRIQKKSNLTLQSIKNTLVAQGLENISIGTKGTSIYVSYENGVFLFNDLDALGIIIGLLQQTDYKKFIIEQKHSKTPVFTLTGDLNLARNFYLHPTVVSKKLFASSLQKVSSIDQSNYKMVYSNVHDSAFIPKIEFSPEMVTFIGNEFGVFNYMLWLRTKLHVNLYKGLDLTAVGDIHVHDSSIENEKKYGNFVDLYKRGTKDGKENGSYLSSAMIHFNNNIFDGINTFSGGVFEEKFAGVVNQYIFNYQNSTFKLKAGYFKQFIDDTPEQERWLGSIYDRYLMLAKYSYLLEDYDTFVELRGGQYWNQDLGFDIKLKRFFGDIAVYLRGAYSKPFTFDDGSTGTYSENTNKFVGLGIEIPLTLRHTPLYKYGQVRGTNSFAYSVNTTIKREDGSNTLVLGSNEDPEVDIESEKYFYNRNRLQLSYFRKHAFRFIEAYEKFIK